MPTTVAPLTITREDAIKLCQELGLPGADEYPNAKLQAKLRSFPKPGVLDAENKPKTERSKCVLEDVRNAFNAEADIIVEGEQPSGTSKPKKGGSKAPAKDKGTRKATKAPSSPAKATGKGKGDSGKPAAKKGGGAKAASANGNGHMTILGAAVKVLLEKGEPMRCKDMIEVMTTKGYWSTPGKTPENTLHARISDEIRKDPDAARFKKVDRGVFALTKHGKK